MGSLVQLRGGCNLLYTPGARLVAPCHGDPLQQRSPCRGRERLPVTPRQWTGVECCLEVRRDLEALDRIEDASAAVRPGPLDRGDTGGRHPSQQEHPLESLFVQFRPRAQSPAWGEVLLRAL